MAKFIAPVVPEYVEPMQGAMMDLVNPVGAAWESTWPLLKRLSRSHFGDLISKDKRALETLTEMFPSVKNSILQEGTRDIFSAPILRNLDRTVQGEVPGTISISKPKNYNSVFERLLSGPPMAYAHEASHAVSGNSSDLGFWAGLVNSVKQRWKDYIGKEVSDAAVEGFAEGSSHAMMDRFNELVYAPYWNRLYKHTELLQKPYLDAGELGVDFGNSIRAGNPMDQRSTIDQLVDIITKHYNDFRNY